MTSAAVSTAGWISRVLVGTACVHTRWAVPYGYEVGKSTDRKGPDDRRRCPPVGHSTGRGPQARAVHP
ncbi:hypothetical protein [Actinomadura sp. SCN-SB]|uniref:hypothetical protein n=1 Tax=Actinomadura sp. SCN-SB TaxID=3373092 RepID=UPI003751F249